MKTNFVAAATLLVVLSGSLGLSTASAQSHPAAMKHVQKMAKHKKHKKHRHHRHHAATTVKHRSVRTHAIHTANV